jgi:hypothetical protein
MTRIERVVYGWLAHWVADWFFQNDWMARNKVDPKHPAGWIHAGIHTVVQIPLLGLRRALTVGIIHWIIDLRTALMKWKQVFRQSIDGPAAMHVAIWEDQIAHLVTIAANAGPLHRSRR